MKGQLLAGLALLAISVGASGQVFKCVDGQGRVTFSQVPCAGQESKAVEIRNNQIGGQLATDKQVDDHQRRRNVEKDLREIDRRLADLKAKDQQGACKKFSDQELRTMIIRHQVVPGMKMSDVFRAWGRPESINGSQHVWWFGTLKGSYVYAQDGCVNSVSGAGYRGNKFVR